MSILKLLGWESADRAGGGAEQSETIRKIAAQLDELEPARAEYLAAFAYILSRVARADMQVSERETREMERIVQEYGELPESQAVLVVQVAKTQSLLFGGTDHFLVTKRFAERATREQKLAALRCLFEVSAADESISTAEDGVVRQIADELNLEHRDFIAVRAAFREHLAVLRKDDDDDP